MFKGYFAILMIVLLMVILPFVVKAANAMTAAGNALN